MIKMFQWILNTINGIIRSFIRLNNLFGTKIFAENELHFRITWGFNAYMIWSIYIKFAFAYYRRWECYFFTYDRNLLSPVDISTAIKFEVCLFASCIAFKWINKCCCSNSSRSGILWMRQVNTRCMRPDLLKRKRKKQLNNLACLSLLSPIWNYPPLTTWCTSSDYD